MSIWTPPASIASLADGQTITAAIIKDLAASLQAALNGNLGNPNVSSDPTEKIAYSKLNLAGAVLDSDIAGISASKFLTLKAKAQASPNNTVQVLSGTYPSLNAQALRSFAGGGSPAIANTAGAGLNRIDVLVINDSGILSVTSGAEGASPVAPAYPLDRIAICEIFVRFSGTGVIVRDTDNSVDSYIRADARPLIQFPGVADAAVTTPKLAVGAIGSFDRIEGTSDLADPGTSFVTMTGMSKVMTDMVVGNGDVALISFQAAIKLAQGTDTALFPDAEIRLMAGPSGSETERAKIVVQASMFDSDGSATTEIHGATGLILPVSLSHMAGLGGDLGLKSFRIEWRRVGAAGTPAVTQPGATYKRVMNMLLLRNLTVIA